MAEELVRQIEQLSGQLEEQRAQITALSQERAANEEAGARNSIEQLTAQLEQQRLQIASLTQDRNDANAAAPSRMVAMPNRPSFDASRVPDSIKLIVPYKGDKKTLSAWIASVEKKLEHAKSLCSSTAEIDSVMPLWVSVIRDKIVDEASQALLSRHTDCEWKAIKKVLTEYFGDKRDLCALVSQIVHLQQNARNINDFYNECKELLADIIDKLSLDNTTKHCVHTLSQSYEHMILNSFIDGLDEPYSMLTRAANPNTLLEAFQSASAQYNAAQRKKEKLAKHTTKVQVYNSPQRVPLQGGYNKFQGPQAGLDNKFDFNRFPQRAHYNNPNREYQNNQFRNNFSPQQNNRGNFNSSQIPPQGNPYLKNNNYRNGSGQNGQSRFPALMNIKPDPSGQSRQHFKNTAQINTHECDEQPHCSNQYDPQYGGIPNEEHSVEDFYEEDQEQEAEVENLNFHWTEGPHQTE